MASHMGESGQDGQGWTRRQIIAAAGTAAAAGVGGLLAGPLLAQPTKQPNQPNRPGTQPGKSDPSKTSGPTTSPLDLAMKPGRTRDWVLKTYVTLGSLTNAVVGPDGKVPGVNNPSEIQNTRFKFDTAALIFPAIQTTAASTSTGNVKATVKVNGKDVTSEATWLDDMAAGSRYGRWDMKNILGHTIEFDTEMEVTCFEYVWDEMQGAKVTWPASGKWPRAAQTSFAPQMGIEPGGKLALDLLNSWTSQKDPKSIPQVQLAKFLASKALEAWQPSGDGLKFTRTGLLQGFVLAGSEQVIRDGKGSEHDIACALTAIYRSAGIPARPVIGYDISESKGEDKGLAGKSKGKLRSWVEFCLYDEQNRKELWVPVDIVRMRRSSSRAPALDKPWKYFGNNDQTDDVIPVAFHYHPPTTVVAHGAPCFWGWLTMPETQIAEQTVRFVTQSQVRTPEKPGRNR